MRKSLGKILQWILLGVLFLGIPSALADPINQIAGVAGQDTASPRVWRHGTAHISSVNGSIALSTTQYHLGVSALLYGCDATCANMNPVLQMDPSIDGQLASVNGLAVTNFNYGFNGTTWDRLRTADIDDIASGTPTGVLATQPYLFNATTGFTDRARAAGGDAMIAATGMSAAGNMVFDGTVWNRMRERTDTAAGTGLLGAVPMALNSANNPTATAWNQLAAAGPNTLTATANGARFLLTVPASTWSATHTPAVATQATASQAAGAAGVRHVATTITACLAAGATAQTPVVVNLRDGATGAGTVLRSWAISAPVNDSKCSDLSGLAMLGTAATAMTIEFAAAGVAGSQQTVTLTGFSTQN